MAPVEMCTFVDSIHSHITSMNDPIATQLLFELSSLAYSLVEGGDTNVEEVFCALCACIWFALRVCFVCDVLCALWCVVCFVCVGLHVLCFCVLRVLDGACVCVVSVHVCVCAYVCLVCEHGVAG